MRVLFVTVAAGSHLGAQVPLAWALRAAGHQVCVASQPDLEDEIVAAGLAAVPVGPPLDQEGSVEELRRRREEEARRLDGEPPDAQELMRVGDLSPDRLGYDRLHGTVTVMTSAIFQNFSARETVDDLVGFARHWRPDLVVWDTMLMAGAVAARACGAAHARLLYGLDLVGRMREEYLAEVARRPADLREDPLAEWLGWTMARYGGAFGEDLVVGQWTIDPIPSSMRLAVDHHYVPMGYVPFNGRAVIPSWLREPPARRRVCLTLGVSFREVMGGDQASIGALLEALAGLDVEVVATLDADQLATVDRVPGNVRVVDFVALNELLPSCSAIVHQGGFGTAQTALAHGVPQVIVPSDMWDAIARAQRVQRSGAGLCVSDDGRPPAVAELRDALVRVLAEPSFARAAAGMRAEVRGAPAPADLVPLLEKLTARHRG
ncbi:glycosyl transferase family 28 [Actinomadura craniellae]|uniref:Glycosyl transferase family 28 n=2 Tax=Actinomadura craniellae TaxID=2231787 RepID=A0A365H102_9ACTN|nr:glycosyl transferase family 28 [Actinomadura craniellae]